MTETKRLRPRVQHVPKGKSRTVQSDRELVDANQIVNRYRRTGLVTHLNNRAPMYGDFSQSVSLQQAFDQVLAAQDAFMQMPASVRQAAQNDPVRLLEMLATEEETEKLIEAGLDAEIAREGDPEEAPAEPDLRAEGSPAPSEPDPGATST